MDQVVWENWDQCITQTCSQSHRDFLLWELQAELGHDNPLVLVLLLVCQFCSFPKKPTEGEKKIPIPDLSTPLFPLNSTVSLQLPCFK